MTVMDATAVALNLEGDCVEPGCFEMASATHKQLAVPKYSQGVSLMPVPDSREAWESEHRTARKRAWRAERLGYTFSVIDRSAFSDDIYDINTSLESRQGRPMSDGYTTRTQQGRLPAYPCDRHRINTYGVIEGDRLRAYLTLYRVGDLAMVSMILGHGDHLANDIMYLLFAGVVGDQAGRGGWFFYNRHDSGTDGLRYYKERCGFEEGWVAWSL